MFLRKKVVKLPDGWVLSEGDTHDYMIYECGCSFHKITNLDKRESKKKWKHCQGHQMELNDAKEKLDRIWQSIIDGNIRRRKKASEAKMEDLDLPSIAECKSDKKH